MRSPRFYAGLSVATSFATMALKFGAYAATGSVGLLSDALESLVNVAASLAVFAALSYAAAAPDREHNFGHEKAQYFSSGLEGALVFAAAGAIAWAAWPQLANPVPVQSLGAGSALALLAAAANAGCAFLLLKAARVHRSIALEADARHLLSDVWTTVGVLAGVVAAKLAGWPLLDPLVALAVAAHLLWTGGQLVRRSFDGLMDRALPDDEVARITAILESVKTQGGAYHRLRTRQAGAQGFVDVHVLVPGARSVQEGHDLIEGLEARIREALPHVDVLIHLEPIEDPRSWEGAPSA